MTQPATIVAAVGTARRRGEGSGGGRGQRGARPWRSTPRPPLSGSPRSVAMTSTLGPRTTCSVILPPLQSAQKRDIDNPTFQSGTDDDL